MPRDIGDVSTIGEVTADYLVRIVDNPNSDYPVEKLIPGAELTPAAGGVSVADAGGYYTGTNVETVLAEVGGGLARRAVERAYIPDPNDFRTTTSMVALALDTADGFDEVLHPSVAFSPEQFGGFHYWMAATPYYNYDSQYENPHIYCSNDGNAWAAPAGLTNPLEAQPAGVGSYNSDTHLLFGPDGRLYLFWRAYETPYAGATERIYYRASADGVTWTTKTLSLANDEAVRRLMSPAVLHINGTWVMYAVDILPSPNVVVRLTAASPDGPWSSPTTVTVDAMPAGKEPWHIDVQQFGGSFIALVNDTTLDAGGSGGNVFVCTSSDGLTFTRAAAALIAIAGSYTWYRSSAVPSIRNGQIGLDVFYSKFNPPVKIHRTWAPMCSIADRFRDDVGLLLGRSLVSPWVAADTFNRANSAATPGSLDSGQAWSVTSGTAGISANQFYSASNNNTKAEVNLAVADFWVEMAVPVQSANTWLIFRVSDASNFWRFGTGSTTGALSLQKVEGGSVTTVITGGCPFTSGRSLGVRCFGSDIRLYIDRIEVGSYASSFNSTATKVGPQVSDNVARISKFVARTLIGGL